jgi:hypothetical protein
MMRVFSLIFTSWCKKLINKRGCHILVYLKNKILAVLACCYKNSFSMQVKILLQS